MTKLVSVSRETHAQKVWQRPASYQFAAKEPLAPIVLAELVHVGSWMPIVFVAAGGPLRSDGHDVPDAGTQSIRRAGRSMAGRLRAVCVAELIRSAWFGRKVRNR